LSDQPTNQGNWQL